MKNMDWMEKTNVTADVDKLKERFNNLKKQEEDIKFYEDAVIDKFIDEIKNTINMQFPFNNDFFRGLCNKKHEKHDDNIKLTLHMLQKYISEKITCIDDVLSVGFDMYGVNVCFSVDNANYELIIPVRQNLCKGNVVTDNYIDWNAGKFILLKQDEKYDCCWNTVWSGYDLAECDYDM